MALTKLNRNSRFSTVRAKTGNVSTAETPAPDGAAAPVTVAEADRFDADGSHEVVFFWDGVSPGGTIEIALYILDGIVGNNRWIRVGEVTGLAPRQIAVLEIRGASQAFLQFKETSAGTGTDPVIRAQAWHP